MFLENEIREILIKDWDPIGINFNENLSDEYDLYIHQIYSLLESGTNIEQMSDYLHYLEKEVIETCTNNEIRNKVAKKLINLFV